MAAAATAAKPAAPAVPAQQSQQFVDGIAAVVNQTVITLQQVNAETRFAQDQLKRQNIPVPDYGALQKQVLQRMISEELERQEAERLGIKVTDAQTEQAVQSIAQRNQISVERLRQEVEKSGVPWDRYLKNLQQEVRMDMLRQRAVDSTIVISDADIDAFLKNQASQPGGGQSFQAQPQQQQQQQAQPAAPAQQSGPQVLGLAQILVAIPEGSSSARVQELRKKAESLLARVRGGADFAGVAAASSDGPKALEGGEMGVRPAEGWPDLFLQATKDLKPGDVSGIIQSGNGFHILKVLTRGQPAGGQRPPAQVQATPSAPSAAPQEQGPMMVTQTHARHILIKSTKVMSDDKAESRLNQLRERLVNGTDQFEDMAKRYSEDVSAPQGGDLGWLTPGETVPAFEKAMNELQPAEISFPIKSQFGWHLIQVIDRRSKNMENEFRRMQARQTLFQRRVEPAFEDWLSQLRGQAYVDNRLDPQSNRNRR
jgi:peptidyl-prolyl cis-trans isomerase SurA